MQFDSFFIISALYKSDYLDFYAVLLSLIPW
jgi:hypothetical protein